ncbi:MAG: carbamoyltransferase N-terminal domain-containing protein [Planctomycetota bacterium]
MKILGISAFHSNAAAALVVDGRCVAAAQEERFSRLPRDASFPMRAVRHVLAQAGLASEDLDLVVFYEKPLRRFERLLFNQLRHFPAPAGVFSRTMFTWLGDRLWLKNRIGSEIGVPVDRVRFTSHHQAHAASAFFPSPFDQAAVLVADGAGERSTTSLSRGDGTELELLTEIAFPHSLGLFYSAFTQFLGFEPDRDEHLVEALAAHGTPRFEKEVGELLRLADDGSFEVKSDAFRFAFDHEQMFGEELEEIFGKARIPGAPLDLTVDSCPEADLAASVQRRVEDALLGLARELKRRVPADDLCVAGTLGLNQTAMARLLREGPFDNLFVQPAADDAGGALGAALFAWHVEASGGERWRQNGALGVEPRGDVPEEASTFASSSELTTAVSAALRDEELVGWVRGRSGFGPGSFGQRVCLAIPGAKGDVRDALARGLAPREPFLPLPVLVRTERAAELLDLPEGAAGPLRYGQLAVPATARLRDAAPACVAPDGTVRPRVVSAGDEPELHAVLSEVESRGGPPLLVELELAQRGEPPVRGEAEARDLFERTQLALLVVDDRYYRRDGR